MTSPIRGAWVDDPIRDVMTEAYWAKFAAHGLTSAPIMVEPLGNGLDPSYSVEALEKMARLAAKEGVRLSLTFWPEPNPEYMADLVAKAPLLLAAANAAAIEVDDESNMLAKKVDGYSSLHEANHALVEALEHIKEEAKVRVELTTFTYHVENSEKAEVAPFVDVLFGQAYSVRDRTEGKIDWDSNLGPGGMQTTTFSHAKKIHDFGTADGVKLGAGLAAYDQVWPGRNGEEAMQAAWLKALEFQPVEVRWWSTKWIFGAKANGYASRFLKSLR